MPRPVLIRRLVLIAAVFLLAYIGSYFTLSRWSLRVLNDFDNNGFWYVPVEPATMNRNPALKHLHTALTPIYRPIWAIDHALNGTPEPDGVDFIDETRD